MRALLVIAGLLFAVAPVIAADAEPRQTGVAIFAGGCFWCLEYDFEKLDGVIEAESGYTAGHLENPSYEQVGRGDTGHTEAVRVIYDPEVVSYAQLLDYFWRNIDPTQKDRQFCDSGPQYRSGIYWLDAAQREAAEASLEPVRDRFGVVYTEIEEASTFWLAEDYHQNYAKRNPVRYRFYRSRCGRDARLRELWG
jgi:peptide-methionine (S)-S-oxide reductase